jgi:hypothetical protein
MSGKVKRGVSWLKSVMLLWAAFVGFKILFAFGQENMARGVVEALLLFIGAFVITGIPAFILGWATGKNEPSISELASVPTTTATLDSTANVSIIDEPKTEITGGNAKKYTLPQAKSGESLLQGRTPQIAGGVLAVLLLMGAAYWYLVERNIIREPVYKVGDTWTTAYYYGLSDNAESNKWIVNAPKEETVKVARVGEGSDIDARIVGGLLDGANLGELWVNDDGRETKRTVMRFPLKPGKTWDTSSLGQVGKFQTHYQKHVQIGNWETVTVLAGSFRTLPVHTTIISKWVAAGSEPSTETRNITAWFSAETKQVVKLADSKMGILQELKSYSVK